MKPATPEIDEKPYSPGRAAWTAIGLGGTFFCITLMFAALGSLMEVGGFCASGGPYVISVPCPDGIEWIMPLGFFSVMIGFFVYAGSRLKHGPDWSIVSWAALFVSLGWGFLMDGLNPSGGEGLRWGSLGIAVFFALMGLAPILLIGEGAFVKPFVGQTPDTSKGTVRGLESQGVQVVLHIAATVGGFILAQFLLRTVS